MHLATKAPNRAAPCPERLQQREQSWGRCRLRVTSDTFNCYAIHLHDLIQSTPRRKRGALHRFNTFITLVLYPSLRSTVLRFRWRLREPHTQPLSTTKPLPSLLCFNDSGLHIPAALQRFLLYFFFLRHLFTELRASASIF